jgi:ketosteroid isomerase-like protein
MKKNYLIAFVVVLAVSIGSTTLFGQSEKADKLKAKIEKMNAKMIKAMHADDHETLSAMYVDDVYSMPSYSPMVIGKQKMIEREKENQEAGFKMLDMKFDVVDVIPAGNYAIEIGKYEVTMKMPQMEGPMNDKGKYVTVWEEQKDGSLKIKVETWNSDVNPMEMGKMMEHEHMQLKDRDTDMKK